MKLPKLEELRELLKKGLYLQNLYMMTSLCAELAKVSKIPLPYYFLKSVFLDITQRWEGEALPADKADVSQSFLLPEINNLIKLIEDDASKEALFDAMNEIGSMCSKY